MIIDGEERECSIWRGNAKGKAEVYVDGRLAGSRLISVPGIRRCQLPSLTEKINKYSAARACVLTVKLLLLIILLSSPLTPPPSMPSPAPVPSPHAVLGSLTAAFRSRESLSSSSSIPRSPASSASLPSLTDAGSSSSCSSLSSLSSVAPNEHLAVLLPRYLWKQDTDAAYCDTFVCSKPFSLMERRHVCALRPLPLSQSSRAKLWLSPLCSIVESAVASIVVPAPRALRPSSTRHRCRLSTPRVVRPSRRTRRQPRRFSLHACATRAMHKSMAPLPLTRPHPRPRRRRLL